MTLATSLDFTNVVGAKLEFYTQYAIESSADFGQVLASTDGGTTWQTLQGTLMGPGNGTAQQPAFAPGYDGIRHDWEKEEIRLDAFAQKPSVLLKFRFRSDDAEAWRGWYVDNIRVIGYSTKRTAVEATTSAAIPLSFSLEQNYPNPLRTNAATTIRFGLSQRDQVKLTVVDVLGRQVATLLNGWMDAGAHAVVFNTKGLPSGIYFYRLATRRITEKKKMVIFE